MKPWTAKRLIWMIAISLGVWAVLATLCLMVGSTGEFGWPSGEAMKYRREAVLLASLVGAALASAGVVYQAVLQNPLADPYLLGVSSGAMLAAYLWLLPWATRLLITSTGWAFGQQSAAFIGALVAIGIVFAMASRARTAGADHAFARGCDHQCDQWIDLHAVECDRKRHRHARRATRVSGAARFIQTTGLSRTRDRKSPRRCGDRCWAG